MYRKENSVFKSKSYRVMSKSSICHYFNSPRGCHFGENCKFLHTIPSKPSFKQKSDSFPKDGDAVNNLNEAAAYPKSNTRFSKEPGTNNNHDGKELTNLCFNFKKFGNCRFGEKCRFLHERETESVTAKPVYSSSHSRTRNQSQHHHHKNQGFQENKTVCEFFKAGNCRWGSNCRYLHPCEDDLIEESVDSKPQRFQRYNVPFKRGTAPENTSWRQQPTTTPYKPSVVQKDLKRSEASDEDIDKLRSLEIQQLKKRFTKNQLKEVDEDGEEKIYRLSFSSSDPDWPYDVKIFELLVKFPKQYPLQIFEVTLPVDQNLPETVRRFIEISICEWTDKKQKDNEATDKLEMDFRPFIKWLDKNLENIVTEGLKQLKRELVAQASGLQFIPASQLQQKSAGTDDSADEDSEVDDSDGSSDHSDLEPVKIYRKNDSEEDEVYTGPERDTENTVEENENLPLEESDNLINDDKKGTEIRLRELQLKEQASTLTINEIKITLQCSRCKHKFDLMTPAGRVNQMVCSKCSNIEYLIYRPVLAHQFSSVIGYLDVEGCLPFDLLLSECPGRVGCLNCSKETKIQGMAPGQLLNVWCHSCHSKLRVAAESVKFTSLQPSGVDTDGGSVHFVSVKKKKIPKDPMIKEGFPLPDNGTCKHYKKSYRWFRFPCCGKCYPCDVCHEENEMDHEMIFATRMICGYCCKEQPYAPEKPCILCQHAMTRGKTAHWEGGKEMTKSKYSNQSKTVSRKAQEKAKPVGKKNDKLRHVSA
ncbi:hypothetical protein KUTeg_017491 [Tegillarca granosa]|uniref:Nucleoporin NUP42 n=1 Tax=Tegillarca granosa TaxID=220873 RepID=A0ABQ9EF12_TEGGR|nr:hypothetical protein KUTeg_017491 [Tegillarca granosa]